MKRTIWILASLLAIGAASAAAEDWSFNTGPGGRLEIDLETGGGIEIRGEATNTVTIKATIKGRDADEVRMSATSSGNVVKVQSEWARRMRNSSAGANIVVTVPDRYDIEFETTGGSIEISDVEGDIDGETMGGELDLRNLRGKLSVSTMGGDITVADSQVDGRVKTMGGSITFRNVSGDFDGETMGGNVLFDNAAAAGAATTRPVTVSTMGGNIKVANAPLGATVSTMGGNIHIDSAREFIKAETMGGEITVDEVDGDVDVSTMGGDVDVIVVGNGHDVNIESKGGDIELSLPAGFSGRFDLEVAVTRDGGQDYEIRSDFPVQTTRSSEWVYDEGSPRKYIYGKGGSGSNTVTVRTINGDIVIKKK